MQSSVSSRRPTSLAGAFVMSSLLIVSQAWGQESEQSKLKRAADDVVGKQAPSAHCSTCMAEFATAFQGLK